MQGLKVGEDENREEDWLRSYPNLRKNKKNTELDRGDIPGKNRKYVEQKQYFKSIYQQTEH